MQVVVQLPGRRPVHGLADESKRGSFTDTENAQQHRADCPAQRRGGAATHDGRGSLSALQCVHEVFQDLRPLSCLNSWCR